MLPLRFIIQPEQQPQGLSHNKKEKSIKQITGKVE